MALVSMKTMLECGVHFGHRTRKLHPKMRPYVFTERNGIHILNLQITQKSLRHAYDLVRKTAAAGGTVLFVGTKRQAQETIADEANRCGMPYVNYRWLGGTLTNWRTIGQRVRYLEALERRRDAGEFDRLTKKEALRYSRQIARLNQRVGGLRTMKGLPDLVFVVDVCREETAIKEANRLGIPVVAVVDSNCDPSNVDYVIPSNDDAIRAIKLIVGKIADAVLEGKAIREKEEAEAEEAAAQAAAQAIPQAGTEEQPELAEDELLGASTLEKIQQMAETEAPASPEEAAEAAPAAEAEAEEAETASEDVPAETKVEQPAEEEEPPEA
jgi:small subunit ribosomal protein S2